MDDSGVHQDKENAEVGIIKPEEAQDTAPGAGAGNESIFWRG